MLLRRRKLGENGHCRLAVVELGQDHFTVDWDVPVDRPQFCIHLEYVLGKPRVKGKNRIENHLGALTAFIVHLALHLDSIIRTASGLVKIHSYDTRQNFASPVAERRSASPSRRTGALRIPI
jgi:hypothetical protein